VLPPLLFKKLFRQDLLVASIFRNFLLAERILRSAGCTPISVPALPATHQHPMWQSWDLAAELCLSQLAAHRAGTPSTLLSPANSPARHHAPTNSPMRISRTTSNLGSLERILAIPNASSHAHAKQVSGQSKPLKFVNSTFYSNQLTAFEVWLEFGSETKQPPEQLPIVLQVLLSQAHRLRALVLLARFLDLGSWATNLALSVGIFPYVLKLLQSPAKDLREVLVFIWAKILELDKSCQDDLVKDGGQAYFITVLASPKLSTSLRTLAAFVLTVIMDNCNAGKAACLHDKRLLQTCLAQLSHPDPLFRRWLIFCLAKLWEDNEDSKWAAIRAGAHERLCSLLTDPVPEVRAAVVYALGAFIGIDERASAESREQRNNIELNLGVTLPVITADASPMVRKELIIALSRLVSSYESRFREVALEWWQEEMKLVNKLRKKAQKPADPLQSSSPTSDDRIYRMQQSSVYACLWKVVLSLRTDPFPTLAAMVESVVHRIHCKIDTIVQYNRREQHQMPSRHSVLTSRSQNTLLLDGAPIGQVVSQRTTSSTNVAATPPRPESKRQSTSNRSKISRSVGNLFSSSSSSSSSSFSSSQQSSSQTTHTGTDSPQSGSQGGGSGHGGPTDYTQDQRLGLLWRRHPGLMMALDKNGELRSVLYQWSCEYFTKPLLCCTNRSPAAYLSSVARCSNNAKEPGHYFFSFSHSPCEHTAEKNSSGALNNVNPSPAPVSNATDSLTLPFSVANVNSASSSSVGGGEESSSELDSATNQLESPFNAEQAWIERRNNRIISSAKWLYNRTRDSGGKDKSSPKLDYQLAILDNDSVMAYQMVFHPFEPLLYACSDKDRVHIWDWQKGTQLARFSNGNPLGTRITNVRLINPNRRALLATGSSEGVVRIWNTNIDGGPALVSSNALLGKSSGTSHATHLPYSSHHYSSNHLVTAWKALTEFVPRSRGAGLVFDWRQEFGTLAASGDIASIRVWDVERELCIQDCQTGCDSSVSCLSAVKTALSPNSLLAGFGNGNLRTFDCRAPSTRYTMGLRFGEGHDNWIVNADISPSKQMMISGSIDGHVKIWDLRKSSVPVQTIKRKAVMTSLAIHPYAPIFVCGYQTQRITVFDYLGQELSIIKYHEGFLGQRIGPIASLAFHPYLLYLAAGATDSIISVYEGWMPK